MEVDVSNLNKFFNIEGDDYMEVSDDFLEPIAYKGHIPFWTDKNHTQESRELMSKKALGRKMSKEARENNSRAQKGKVYSEEYKRNMEVARTKNSYELTFDDGKVVIIKGLNRWCKDNGYSYVNIHCVKRGERKYHKDIVKVEKIG